MKLIDTFIYTVSRNVVISIKTTKTLPDAIKKFIKLSKDKGPKNFL
jgi:hypothetical protein